MNDKELWLPIEGYEGLYEVSDRGRVRSLGRIVEFKKFGKSVKSLKKGKVLDPVKRDEYLGVCLSKDGVRISHLIHRLVARVFIPNPNNYPQINHKDEDKFNNCANNLEWCTAKYNDNYGNRNKKLSESMKGVKRKDKNALWQ